jgi:hypothetical protein
MIAGCGPYYYRHVRVNGQVRKVYVGRGQAAKAAAQETERRRQQRQAEREQQDRDLARLTDAERSLEDLQRLVTLLVRMTLEKANFRYVRGHWRKKRHDQNRHQAALG